MTMQGLADAGIVKAATMAAMAPPKQHFILGLLASTTLRSGGNRNKIQSWKITISFGYVPGSAIGSVCGICPMPFVLGGRGRTARQSACRLQAHRRSGAH